MIELLPAPDHVVAVRLEGTLTGADFDRLVEEIEAKLARHERLGIFADMVGFKDFTAEAAAKDLRYNLGKLGEWRRFPREAVVTDRQWVKTLVRLIDPVIPHVEVRTFAPAERDEALAWASAAPDSNPAH